MYVVCMYLITLLANWFVNKFRHFYLFVVVFFLVNFIWLWTFYLILSNTSSKVVAMNSCFWYNFLFYFFSWDFSQFRCWFLLAFFVLFWLFFVCFYAHFFKLRLIVAPLASIFSTSIFINNFWIEFLRTTHLVGCFWLRVFFFFDS